ncbi:MAG: hypothetical protein WCW31_00395 [Patescibacteria group bacterium]|jgi:hypothetical protein
MKLSWYSVFTYVIAPLVALFFLLLVLALSFNLQDGIVSGDVFYVRFQTLYIPLMALLAVCTIAMIVGLAKRKLWGLLLLFFVSGMWVFKSATDIILSEFQTSTVIIQVAIIGLILANLGYFYWKRRMFE